MSMMLLLSDDSPNPRSLFASGEQGFWYDPSDFSTLFQDAAGTLPVTAVGQSVGRINDKSGRGNHATQSTALSRPTLQQDSTGRYYLSFDGTDDGMATPSIDFTGTGKMTVWAGVRKLSDAAAGIVVELSADRTVNNGTFTLVSSGSPAFLWASKGTADSTNTVTGNAAPVTRVLCGIGDISGDKANLRVNGTETPGLLNQGTGNFGNYPLYIGRRGGTSLPFNGRLYGLIVRGAASNAGQIATAEAWMNSKTRAY